MGGGGTVWGQSKQRSAMHSIRAFNLWHELGAIDRSPFKPGHFRLILKLRESNIGYPSAVTAQIPSRFPSRPILDPQHYHQQEERNKRRIVYSSRIDQTRHPVIIRYRTTFRCGDQIVELVQNRALLK